MRAFDLAEIRADFPVIAERMVHGKPLVYLDSGATAQKPQVVIDSIDAFYRTYNANINRGVHALAEQTTIAYEQSRQCVADFIGVSNPDQLVFTSGTTESINLVAHGLSTLLFEEGDEILLSQMEHHANIVPWQQVCDSVGARLQIVALTADGQLDFDDFTAKLNPKTKLVSLIHVSNVMGCETPVKAVIDAAHAQGTPVLLDGAQAVPHIPVDVVDLDCDFYVFSAHKLYGPTGIGALYAKSTWLDAMRPYQTGGDMIRRVTFAQTTFNKAPQKFEAGTPNIAGAIGFAEAIRYISQFSWEDRLRHEREVTSHLVTSLQSCPGLRLLGPAADKRIGLCSFILDGLHAHDLGSLLDQEGVAVRVGHHCAMPLMEYLGVPAATRASLGLYSSKGDVDDLMQALDKARSFFGL